MFEDLKKNIEQEKKIVADMRSIDISMQNDRSHRDFYVSSLNSLLEQLVLLNKAVPDLLKEGSPLGKFAGERVVGKKVVSNTIRMSYVSPATKEKRYISINKADKKAFLEKLKLSEEGLMGLQRIQRKKVVTNIIRKPSLFAKVSNRYFGRYSEKMAPNFGSLAKDLKKGNISFLMSTYLSMALFSSVIAFLVGLLAFGILLVFSLSNWIYVFLPFGLTGITMAGFYLYPASEASSVQKKISYELPFVAIHMAAVANSNVEPTKIFRIIAASSEYPNVGKEMRKVLTQVEVYGYDLVTSLKNVALRTSNKRLAELFSGFATNISSGGELKSYLEKKAENFLLDYRLERQKYSDLAGTFMDVYISILIAAPLVLMMSFREANPATSGIAT